MQNPHSKLALLDFSQPDANGGWVGFRHGAAEAPSKPLEGELGQETMAPGVSHRPARRVMLEKVDDASRQFGHVVLIDQVAGLVRHDHL
jgi:hypothetical protein